MTEEPNICIVYVVLDGMVIKQKTNKTNKQATT